MTPECLASPPDDGLSEVEYGQLAPWEAATGKRGAGSEAAKKISFSIQNLSRTQDVGLEESRGIWGTPEINAQRSQFGRRTAGRMARQKLRVVL